MAAIAIIVAVGMTALCVVSAMVLDFGLVRVDRQIDSSGADAATLAGLHGLLWAGGDGNPHPYAGVCTAVRYLKANHPRFNGITENVGWTDGLNAFDGQRLLERRVAQQGLLGRPRTRPRGRSGPRPVPTGVSP